MKKILFLLMAIVLGVSAAYAGKKYTVTVTYEIINVYFKSQTTQEVGSKSLGTSTETFTIYAETPHEAEQAAVSQCSTVCNTYNYVDQGDEMYNGVECDVKQYRRVVSARAQ